jgi:hypothetical protein
MWISANLDAGSSFCEFSHILAGSRMQPASRQQVTIGVAYVSVTGIN